MAKIARLATSVFLALVALIAMSITTSHAGSVDVLGATVSWDDNAMTYPRDGCYSYRFNYVNNTGIELLTLRFELLNQQGRLVTNNSQIGIKPGISGIWTQQICTSAVAPTDTFTVRAEIKDYAGSAREASVPFAFVGATPRVITSPAAPVVSPSNPTGAKRASKCYNNKTGERIRVESKKCPKGWMKTG